VYWFVYINKCDSYQHRTMIFSAANFYQSSSFQNKILSPCEEKPTWCTTYS